MNTTKINRSRLYDKIVQKLMVGFSHLAQGQNFRPSIPEVIVSHYGKSATVGFINRTDIGAVGTIGLQLSSYGYG